MPATASQLSLTATTSNHALRSEPGRSNRPGSLCTWTSPVCRDLASQESRSTTPWRFARDEPGQRNGRSDGNRYGV
jgi:hypothetical protein